MVFSWDTVPQSLYRLHEVARRWQCEATRIIQLGADDGLHICVYVQREPERRDLRNKDQRSRLERVSGLFEVPYQNLQEIVLTGETKLYRVEVGYRREGKGRSVVSVSCPGRVCTAQDLMITSEEVRRFEQVTLPKEQRTTLNLREIAEIYAPGDVAGQERILKHLISGWLWCCFCVGYAQTFPYMHGYTDPFYKDEEEVAAAALNDPHLFAMEQHDIQRWADQAGV